MGDPDLVTHRLVRALDADQLLDDLQGPTLVLELVAVAADPFDEQVLDVRGDVGERPGDVVVLAEHDPRQARDRRPAAYPAAELEGALMPHPGHPGGEVRVSGDQRPARRGAARGDGPVV